jgi:hypothetical protein
MTCKRGVFIPDGAIEEMKARVVVTDEDLKIAAAEGMPLAICFMPQTTISPSQNQS